MSLLDSRPVTTRPSHVAGVAVLATDPLVRAGLRGELRDKPGIELLEDPADADVVVVVADSALHELLPVSTGRLVLVTDASRQAELWSAVEHGLAVLVPRAEATTPRLLRAIADAHRGRGDLPAEQLGSLLRAVSQLHRDVLAPKNLTLAGMSHRETDVLRLLSDGLDTAQIATKLSYSERTVKNILHGLLTRLGLRNRTHAVAQAIRMGLI